MLLLARQFEDANSRAEKALEIDPKNVEALILHANALAGLNKLDDALNEVEAAIREEPDRTASYTILGAMQMVHGDRKEAEAAFRKAVETDPKSVDARLALVNYLWAVGRRSDAEEQLKEALKIDPKNILANRAMALFYIGARQPKEAEPYLKTLAEVAAGWQPASSSWRTTTSRCSGATRRDASWKPSPPADSEGRRTAPNCGSPAWAWDPATPAAAMKLIDEVLAKDPQNWEALLAKAQTLLGLGKVGEASPRSSRRRRPTRSRQRLSSRSAGRTSSAASDRKRSRPSLRPSS